MVYLINKYHALGDPGKGIYDFKEQGKNEYIWVTRTTPVKKYVDDIIFEFEQKGKDCEVYARSRSQSLSYYDYATNYCNMWNPLVLSGHKLAGQLNVHDCKFQAGDPYDVCKKY